MFDTQHDCAFHAQCVMCPLVCRPGQDSQESRPQPRPQPPPSQAPADTEELDHALPRQQHALPLQPAENHNVHPPADTAADAATPAQSEDPPTSIPPQHNTAPGQDPSQAAKPLSSADSTLVPGSSSSTGKPVNGESQQASCATQEAAGEAVSRQLGSDSSQEAGEAAAAGTTAHAAAASTNAVPLQSPLPVAAPTAGPGSMQDFLSFLLPAENPPAAPGPSSRAASPHPPPRPLITSSPPTASATANISTILQHAPNGTTPSPATRVDSRQHQASRRVKPYTTTAQGPAAPYRPPSAAPYRPPSAVYDPPQADALLPSQGVRLCVASLHLLVIAGAISSSLTRLSCLCTLVIMSGLALPDWHNRYGIVGHKHICLSFVYLVDVQALTVFRAGCTLSKLVMVRTSLARTTLVP